jgi:hypothetical protein
VNGTRPPRFSRGFSRRRKRSDAGRGAGSTACCFRSGRRATTRSPTRFRATWHCTPTS